MNQIELMNRVRSLTRDFSGSIFRETDIKDYLNESIDRFRQVLPVFSGMSHLYLNDDTPTHLPPQYHYLLALYSASRCFGQDERHYQATTYMNEFEIKLEEFKSSVEAGDTIIIDPVTNAPVVDGTLGTEYVKTDNYFASRSGLIDDDNGVEGI